MTRANSKISNFSFRAIILSLFVSNLIHAECHAQQVIESIASGNWSNPNIWDSNSVPDPSIDYIGINHEILLDTDINIGNWLVIREGCLSDNGLGHSIEVSVQSVITPPILSVVGGNQASKLRCKNIHIYDGVFYLEHENSSANVIVDDNLVINNSQLVFDGGYLQVNDTLFNLNSSEINISKTISPVAAYKASLITNHLYNDAVIYGDSGSICMENNLVNTINGSFSSDTSTYLDVCDNTPSSSGDIENGTYLGNVTFCTNSDCIQPIQCYTFSDITIAQLKDIRMYPNPSSDLIYIDGANNSTIKLFTLDGRLVLSEKSNGKLKALDLHRVDNGIYIVKIEIEGRTIKSERISIIR